MMAKYAETCRSLTSNKTSWCFDVLYHDLFSFYVHDRDASTTVRVYNPGRITKYSVLVWIVHESSPGFICNLQIYDGKSGTLTETVGFLHEPYEGKGYHLYQDNYYNSVHQTNELLIN